MRLIGKSKLKRAVELHPTARLWVNSWTVEVAQARWKHPTEVREQFPRVQLRPSGSFAFPVADTGSDLVLSIAFPVGVAVIEEFINRDGPYGR